MLQLLCSHALLHAWLRWFLLSWLCAEGLKVLFRPITVVVPDLVLICENMLMAEGFGEAKALAVKVG